VETIQGISRYQGQGYTLAAAAQMAGNKKKGQKEIREGKDINATDISLMD